jgi:hypothetical protein
MNGYIKWLSIVLIAFVSGYFIGNYITKVKFEQQAVHEGAGEYIMVSTDGHKKFIFITPNCGPH